jgi:hypothetical protein
MGGYLSGESNAPRHCHNGQHDVDEEAIDCGGPCPACGRTPDYEAAIIIKNYYDFDGVWAGQYLMAAIYNLVWADNVAHVHYGYARPGTPENVVGQDSRTYVFDFNGDGSVVAMGEYLSASALAPLTCRNGLNDNNEDGIDCGGSCVPCGQVGEAEAALMIKNYYDFHGLWSARGTSYQRTGRQYVMARIYNLIWVDDVVHVHYGYARPPTPPAGTDIGSWWCREQKICINGTGWTQQRVEGHDSRWFGAPGDDCFKPVVEQNASTPWWASFQVHDEDGRSRDNIASVTLVNVETGEATVLSQTEWTPEPWVGHAPGGPLEQPGPLMKLIIERSDAAKGETEHFPYEGGAQPAAAPCPVASYCSPVTCNAVWADCGEVDNQCGGILDCGPCPETEVCNHHNECIPRDSDCTVTGCEANNYCNLGTRQCVPFAPRESNPAELGTNLWFMATDWTGETPFVENLSFAEACSAPEVPIWNEAFLEEISIYSLLRFMDWNKTNNSFVTEWDERRSACDENNNMVGSQGREDGPGVAYEWMVDLCNRTGIDMWINIPHAASDDFVANLASFLHERLDSSLRLYVEYSNETWNASWGFIDQHNHTVAEGTAAGLGTGSVAGRRYTVYRSLQIFEIFESLFADVRERLVRVIPGQSANAWAAALQMDCLDNIPEGCNPTGGYADLYAIAPYIGDGLDGSSADIFDLREQIQTNGVDRVAAIAEALAGRLPLGTYEGGQHILDNCDLINEDPLIYDVYLEYLERITPYLDLFTHYAHVSPGGSKLRRNCWGAKQYTGQPAEDAPKYRALMNWRNRP